MNGQSAWMDKDYHASLMAKLKETSIRLQLERKELLQNIHPSNA